MREYDEAIRLNPQVPVAYALRAMAYTLLGTEAEAQADVDKAIDLGFGSTLLTQIEALRKKR